VEKMMCHCINNVVIYFTMIKKWLLVIYYEYKQT
jgi:hypothetical protein